jgi:CO/xanthine dehydrogenase Mo-binding subunit
LVVWGPACTSCGRWLSKNLTDISLPVNADIPTDIQVHFVDEFDAHASLTGARGELGVTGIAAAIAEPAPVLRRRYQASAR